MNYFNTSLALIGVFILFGCNNKREKGCTEEFRSIYTLSVKDTLTSYYTLRLKNNQKIEIEKYDTDLRYPVLNDQYGKLFPNTTEKFVFIGKVGEKIVVQDTFKISSDRCHHISKEE